jgi:hypothetical protein
MASTQLDLFGEAKVEVREPEQMTEVRLGKRSAQIPLRRQRREALAKLREVLAELEGKDVHISTYDAGGRHFIIDNLLLRRLEIEGFPYKFNEDDKYIVNVFILRGARGACIRIFTDYLVAVREQEYHGYMLWLLDFRCGFWQDPVDQFRSHYACLHITRFKD